MWKGADSALNEDASSGIPRRDRHITETSVSEDIESAASGNEAGTWNTHWQYLVQWSGTAIYYASLHTAGKSTRDR
jgi:hypothetical protein